MGKTNKYKRESRFVRPQQNKVLILCGGETENEYFKLYKTKYKDQFKGITIESKKEIGSPLNLIESAIKKEGYHEKWVVFDKDEFACFDEAILLAEKHDIYCAFSNEAFEYWFILHFEDTPRYIERSELNKKVGKYLGILNYSKTRRDAEQASAKFLDKLSILEIAEKRAQKYHEQHQNNYWNRNPNMHSEWKSCTTVYLLTKKLREWSRGKVT